MLPTLNYIFPQKILLFINLKSDQDPDSHGYPLVWLSGSGSAFALRLKAGSGSALNQCGSTTLEKTKKLWYIKKFMYR